MSLLESPSALLALKLSSDGTIFQLTPREYASSHRANRLRSSLGKSDTVTEAIYDAGYNSSGRFYATSNEVLGMTPSNYRAGGASTEMRFAVGECSLGSILVAASARGVCAILLGDDPDTLARDLQDRFPQARLIGGDATSKSWSRKWWVLSKRRPWDSICLSMFGGRPSNNACGKHCERFRPVRRSATPTSPNESGRRIRSGP